MYNYNGFKIIRETEDGFELMPIISTQPYYFIPQKVTENISVGFLDSWKQFEVSFEENTEIEISLGSGNWGTIPVGTEYRVLYPESAPSNAKITVKKADSMTVIAELLKPDQCVTIRLMGIEEDTGPVFKVVASNFPVIGGAEGPTPTPILSIKNGHTLELNDADKFLSCGTEGGGDSEITLPNEVTLSPYFQPNTEIHVFCNDPGGTVITPEAPITMNGSGSAITIAENRAVTLKYAGSQMWFVVGDYS